MEFVDLFIWVGSFIVVIGIASIIFFVVRDRMKKKDEKLRNEQPVQWQPQQWQQPMAQNPQPNMGFQQQPMHPSFGMAGQQDARQNDELMRKVQEMERRYNEMMMQNPSICMSSPIQQDFRQEVRQFEEKKKKVIEELPEDSGEVLNGEASFKVMLPDSLDDSEREIIKKKMERYFEACFKKLKKDILSKEKIDVEIEFGME